MSLAIPTSRLDRMAMTLSGLCLVHCLGTAVMLVRGHYGLEIILGGSARKALPVWRYSPAIRFS